MNITVQQVSNDTEEVKRDIEEIKDGLQPY